MKTHILFIIAEPADEHSGSKSYEIRIIGAPELKKSDAEKIAAILVKPDGFGPADLTLQLFTEQ